MIVLRDNSSRSKLIISLFWVMLGITILNIGSLGWQYSLLSDVQSNPDFIDLKALQTSDMFRTVIGIVQLIILILSMIFFIMWFRRAYFNLQQLQWNYARYSEGWAAGGWFVPILNLFYPFQIMMDIWRGKQDAIKERFGEPQSALLVGAWWTLYLTNNLMGYVSSFMTRGARDVDSLISATVAEAIGEVISIAAIIVTIRLIIRVSNFERELALHVQTPDDSIFSDNYTPPHENTNSI